MTFALSFCYSEFCITNQYSAMKTAQPIQLIDLFPKLDKKLIEVLKSLSLQDWERQTIAPRWSVKDIAVHLLDGNIRTLSMLRDGYFGEKPDPIHSYQDLVDYLNRLNADWTKAMKRISPSLLIELLETTGKQYSDYLRTLHPFDKAAFSVAWAGEEQSDNWFHIAREYTEKWHHQQQIRLAVGQTRELYRAVFYHPHLETSMRALPHHYRDVTGNLHDVIKFTITGEGGGDWFLYHDATQWVLVVDCELKPVCEVSIEGEIAWRIFTKEIQKEEAEKQIKITGEQVLGEKIMDMLAVMA